MLEKLPEEVLNLWNKWEIRGMVLLSLLLQTILIIFGSRRKTIASSWIRILVWSAYLSADMVATVALGNLARSQGDSSCDGSRKANNSIQEFWAPFLLLHLGGPDTITAYSIEDNELWLRQLLGLVSQVGVAFYVFSRSWGSRILTFIAIPMFIVGIIKYAERTWVLRSSSSDGLRNSILSKFRPFYPLRESSKTFEQALKGNYLLQAYTFLDISMFMLQDLVPGIPALMNSQLLISKNLADDAFKVVEVELGLIYDMLYTKAPLVYSLVGIILRSISFLLSSTAFVTFHVMIVRHAYSTIDIAITYLLFVAAVFLEFYAFLCLVLSDWTMIWLIDDGGNAISSTIYSLIRKLTRSERWSRSIAKHNLISTCFEKKPHKCLELLGIDETMRQMYVKREDMNAGIRRCIFGHLQKKCEKIKESFNLIDKNFRSKVVGQRGDGVLERDGLLLQFKWCTTEVDFSQSILVWHLATDICYRVEKNANNAFSEYETSRCLSEYMLYLLVMRPNMLSKGTSDEGYLETLEDLRGLKSRVLRDNKAMSKKDFADQILLLNKFDGVDDPQFQRQWKIAKSVLNGGVCLTKQLRALEFERRWKMINEVWIEMLAYAAAHCPWKQHAQELRRGGELLTHVCFLMVHLGLSEQYEFSQFDYYQVHQADLQILPLEEREEYLQAKDKYFRGNADMSASSSDKEMNKLKTTVEDKDREVKELKKILAEKDQELELLRSRSTASTPQQGIGAIPGGSPAQSDDQGIGQTSSNNEISLSME
uniref:DUF4220 domain-containing protein n=2 Tax=Populus alba TaxID=43335 RepID=A0A4U5QUR9_POPAL|nr:uncharacterized protein LOC118038328 [Populus alba]TKS14872.1 uncharacterized protein D5086_0000039060 [Populus alba]